MSGVQCQLLSWGKSLYSRDGFILLSFLFLSFFPPPASPICPGSKVKKQINKEMWKMGAWLFKWIFLVYNLSLFNIVKKRRDLFEKIKKTTKPPTNVY